MIKEVRTIIIGAGPAGLAVAGRLSHQGIKDYVILESTQHVGNTWRHHYDRLHLHTVKQWSHLPHRPFPADYPLYVSRQQLVSYMDDYTGHFGIVPTFGQQVHRVHRIDSQWQISTQDHEYIADHVVIATGVNRTPKMPSWPGQDSFGGQIIHSKNYKNPSPFIGQRVLVIGMGNTGAEVAFDLSKHDVETYLSVRSPISLVPRDLNGKPVQVTAKMLARFPFGIGDWLGSQIRKVYFGNLEPYGLKISKMPPTVQLRETGKTPVIDIGTIGAIKNGKIKVCPDIKSLGSGHVVTVDDQQIEVDHIILATGYDAELESIVPGVSAFLDAKGLPRSPVGTDELSQLYFIGFDNYKVGGILGTISTESETIVNQITKSTNKTI